MTFPQMPKVIETPTMRQKLFGNMTSAICYPIFHRASFHEIILWTIDEEIPPSTNWIILDANMRAMRS